MSAKTDLIGKCVGGAVAAAWCLKVAYDEGRKRGWRDHEKADRAYIDIGCEVIAGRKEGTIGWRYKKED